VPILRTLADLFSAGASFVAEQFVRGTARFGTLITGLERKYGEDMQADTATVGQLENRVVQATAAAGRINRSLSVQPAEVPTWEGHSGPEGFIHSGLARVTSKLGNGEEIYSTNVPFNFHDAEILNLEKTIERIRLAFEESPSDVQEKYDVDINRVEQLIRFHRIMQTHEQINPEMFGVYQSGGLG
jgi:hypothetical protein